MKSVKLTATVVLLGCMAVSLLLFTPSSAQITKGKERPLLTKHLMSGLIKPHCNAIREALKADTIDDKGWEALEVNAALLNESSYILMADDRCPDGTWANASSKILREGSEDLLKAINAADGDGAKKAFGAMMKSCGACHKAHKGKKKKA